MDEKEELEIRANKLEIIRLLAEKLEYKDYTIDEAKPIAYFDATIDILKREVKNAQENKAKLIKFDKLAAERKNLTPEELEQLKSEQKAINEKVDSYLATLDPCASLRGNIEAPNSIILRYRGKIGSEFSKNYPMGKLM